MKFVIFGFLAAALLSGIGFATLTNAEKECIKGCCESVGGTYEWEHNGCDSPQGEMSGCADSCLQKRVQSSVCPIFALFGILGAALLANCKK